MEIVIKRNYSTNRCFVEGFSNSSQISHSEAVDCNRDRKEIEPDIVDDGTLFDGVDSDLKSCNCDLMFGIP